MDQQLQAHDALAEDLSLAPSTHIGGLISSCNFGSTEIQCSGKALSLIISPAQHSFPSFFPPIFLYCWEFNLGPHAC